MQQPPTSRTPPQPADIKARNKKIIDMVIGAIGWFLLNGLVVGLVWFIVQSGRNDVVPVIGLVALLVNLVALVLLAAVRRWMALGVLIAWALIFVLVVVGSIFLAVLCGIALFIPGVGR